MTTLTVLHGCRTVQLTQGKVALIDEADWPIVGQFAWYARPGRKRFQDWYAERGIRRSGVDTKILLHRELCSGALVDHRDGDGLNNTRENLRPCTTAQNARNRRSILGASRFKGVSRAAVNRKWNAYIKVDGKSINLGSFAIERDAALAYDRAARKYFGEFACTNADIHGDYREPLA